MGSERSGIGQRLVNMLVWGSAVCAIVVGAIHLERILVDDPTRNGPVTRVEESQEYATLGIHFGKQNPAVSVVAFVDYECGVCARADSYLRDLLSQPSNDLSVVYRHYPSAGNPVSIRSAKAALCAREKQRYRKVTDLLYDVTGGTQARRLPEIAMLAGIEDTVSFKECLVSERVERALRRDTVDARKLGVEVTPTFLVNDLKIAGYPGKERMDDFVEAARRASMGSDLGGDLDDQD